MQVKSLRAELDRLANQKPAAPPPMIPLTGTSSTPPCVH
jgi:hypothetical protein